MNDFITELTSLLNKHSLDDYVGMPDYILAAYLMDTMETLNKTKWSIIERYVSDPDPGDLDGDHSSALSSVGWGTDEDYN